MERLRPTLARERQQRKRALEQQRATAEILKVIAASPSDAQPVFDAIVKNAARLAPGSSVNVTRLIGERLHLAAYTPASPSADEVLKKLYPVPIGEVGALANAVRKRSPFFVSDFETDPEVSAKAREVMRARGFRSTLYVPVVQGHVVHGLMHVSKSKPGSFPKQWIELLKTFADQAAIAIENARLFNETKEALEQQRATADILRVISESPTDTRPVFQAIAERAAQICEASDARVFVVEGENVRYVAGFGDLDHAAPSLGIERGWVTGRAIIERTPVHVEDVLSAPEAFPTAQITSKPQGIRTILAVPLVREQRSLGAITLRRTDVRPFTEKQISLLKTFADQAAIAIENVRLFNETKEALEQQKASAEVLGVISNSIADPQPVFAKILESCERLFEGHFMGIGLAGDDGMVHVVARRGFQAEALQQLPWKYPLTKETGSGTAIIERRVLHYPSVLDDAGVPSSARASAVTSGIKSVVFVPLSWEEKGIGSLWVGRSFAGAFADKQISLLKTFADQAAIAIQNARLFREIQDKSAQLEVANKHKSDFLANMSHELRTPLNAIIGFSEVLMDRMFGELNDKQLDYQKDIHESGKHLLSLINDILDLSKIEAGRMELELSTFHLPSAVANAIILVRERAQRHGIELGTHIDPRLGDFEADERKIKQILLNLLSNAVKFTPDGGRVDVSARLDTDKVEIAVKDTGVGIAPADQARLFEEFKQFGSDSLRKAEGTGLGLALTKRLVELHGGQIVVYSTVGQGSTFMVTLPARQQNVLAA